MTEKPQARLRPLEIRDVEAVAAYEREIAKSRFPTIRSPTSASTSRKSGAWWTIAAPRRFVAEDDTGVVGWAYVSKRQNFITKESYADFHSIFVGPSQRGTGTVGKLVDAVFDYCRREKLDRVVFRTRATNEPMKAVLARVGFRASANLLRKDLCGWRLILDAVAQPFAAAASGQSAMCRGMR